MTNAPETKKAAELVVGDRYAMSLADAEALDYRLVDEVTTYRSPSRNVDLVLVHQRDRYGWWTQRLLDPDRLVVIVAEPRRAVDHVALAALTFPEGGTR
jgi:hypothetical protein